MARRSGDDLAYGGFPERWDRSRFERFGGGSGGGGGGGGGYYPQRFQEDYTYREQDRPGRRDVTFAERIDESGPRGRFEESDRYFEEDRYTPNRRRRRTDKELFGDVDPRDFANMALTPYEPPPPPRPGLLRRQSSLDTFDRRGIPVYEREERRIPVYRAEPISYEPERGREYYPPQSYREIEIRREKSVGPYPPPPRSVKSSKSSKSSKSKSKSKVESSSSSSSATEQGSVHPSRQGDRQSVHESFHESRQGDRQSVHESFHESQHWPGGGESVNESFDEEKHGNEESEHFHEHESFHEGNKSVSESINETVKEFKKGKTRMPKRLVRREAIQDLGYPFEEEEFFFVLKIALEKEQIDEVIRISETYWKGEKKTVFQLDESETTKESSQNNEAQGEREEVVRTEWINPPSVAGSRRRSVSHSGGGRRSRRQSRATKDEFFEEKDTFKERETTVGRLPAPRAPEAPVYEVERKTVVKESEEEESFSPIYRPRTRSRSAHRGALVVRRDPNARSDREINDEIARLEAEQRALRLERGVEGRRELVLRDRSDREYDVDWYGRPAREVIEFTDRDRDRDRLERERKERERRRILKVAAATLT